jgi:hypothetical protein
MRMNGSHKSPRTLPAAGVLLMALLVSACAPAISTPSESPRTTTPDGFPTYERFDPADYEPPEPAVGAQEVEIVHDVPPQIMVGRLPDSPARAPVRRTVDGYRIQIFSSDDRRVAEQFADNVRSWWRQARPAAPIAIRQPDVIIDYQRPYYRVRFAAFESRLQADEAIGFVRQRFGDAFVVPDRVTLSE